MESSGKLVKSEAQSLKRLGHRSLVNRQVAGSVVGQVVVVAVVFIVVCVEAAMAIPAISPILETQPELEEPPETCFISFSSNSKSSSSSD